MLTGRKWLCPPAAESHSLTIDNTFVVVVVVFGCIFADNLIQWELEETKQKKKTTPV